MNLFSRVYARAFQTVFHIALPLLPYRSPKILSQVGEVPGLLTQEKISRVLIVTDKSIETLGLSEPLKAALDADGIAYTVYDEVTPNPTIGTIEAAAARYRETGCQGLIGFGGGSPIDCAKAVGARIARPKKPLGKMKGILKVMRPIPYLIAIPTTAGTGSETTLATVITDEHTGHKFPVNDFFLIPRAAVLDPEMTRTLPPAMTSTTGMDALTHAVEAYIGRSTIPSTRRDSLTAVRLISENIETAYREGGNMEARAQMLHAAFLAGRAFTKSYVGYCHAVAHSLGGKYHIPHGLANAVLLPYVLEAYGSSIYRKGKRLAIAMGLATKDTDKKDATQALIRWIRETNCKMGIPDKLRGIRREDIPEMAAYAAKEGNPLYPVPRLMGRRELEQFYYAVMEEEP